MEVGQKVTYLSLGKVEHGIIKKLEENRSAYAFVVYHCDGNWDRYFDYTAARTRLIDLVPGWVEDRAAISESGQHPPTARRRKL